MKKELISEAVSNIKAEYITEAQTPPTANRPWQRRLVAAVVALHLWKHNNLLSIFGGTILYRVLVQAVFV